MAFEPDLDVATQMAADSASLTLGTNLFAGPVLEAGNGIPSKAVFVTSATGLLPTRLFRNVDIVNAMLQIWVRGNPGDVASATEFAHEVWRVTRNMSITSPNEYISVLSLGSGPNSLGQNNVEEWEYSWNIEAKYVETT